MTSHMLSVAIAYGIRSVWTGIRSVWTSEWWPKQVADFQAVLDGLVAAAALTRGAAKSFRGLVVWQLRLGSYPGVDDSWLINFTSSQLTDLDLGGCRQVHSHISV